MALELNLAGKKALITGASEGIGEGIAKRLGAEGVDLYLAARSEDKLNAVADAVRTATGVEVVAVPLDLSISENQQALAARAYVLLTCRLLACRSIAGCQKNTQGFVHWTQ